jgi:hypothetical protein
MTVIFTSDTIHTCRAFSVGCVGADYRMGDVVCGMHVGDAPDASRGVACRSSNGRRRRRFEWGSWAKVMTVATFILLMHARLWKDCC